MAYEIRNSSGEIVANHLKTFDGAKIEAERLSLADDRQHHFTVVMVDEVWKTETLTLSDRPGFHVIAASNNQKTKAPERPSLAHDENETAGALIHRVGWKRIIGNLGDAT